MNRVMCPLIVAAIRSAGPFPPWGSEKAITETRIPASYSIVGTDNIV